MTSLRRYLGIALYIYGMNSKWWSATGQFKRDKFGLPIDPKERALERASYEDLKRKLVSELIRTPMKELSAVEGACVSTADKKGMLYFNL